ncbi:MAG: ATP synthase F1 subunit gamma [Planctomycetota bacterium]
MATSRELRNKIRSISNTKKITRTMEMIATAKSVVCQKRIEAVQPYGDKLTEMLRDLKDGAGEEATNFPLLRVPEKPTSEAVIVITANRGLCGGYNANTLRLAERHMEQRRSQGVTCEAHVIGKKGIARFRFLGVDAAATYAQFDDQPAFGESEKVIEGLLARFASGELDAVTIVSTRYVNAARQVPRVHPVLPIAADEKDAEAASDEHSAGGNFLFEPNPEEIISTLLPLSLKMQLFQALVEAATSEQIARRIAMKNATDNAEEMVKDYTQLYNRTRQAGITQEILEIIGGSAV